MNRYSKPSPVRTEGRHQWGRTVVAGRPVRMRADLRNRRVVIQLDTAEPGDVGVVVAIESEPPRSVLLVNPQQRFWAGASETRARLLGAVLAYYASMEERA